MTFIVLHTSVLFNFLLQILRGSMPLAPTTLRLRVEGVREDLNPITIRVQDKRNVPHSPIRQFLLELHTELLEPLTSSIDIGNSDRDVSKAAGVLVATVVSGEAGVALGTMVMGQLDDTFTHKPLSDLLLLAKLSVAVIVRQEIEVEILVLGSGDEVHAENLLVKVKRGLGILHSKHGMVHAVAMGFSGTSRHVG